MCLVAQESSAPEAELKEFDGLLADLQEKVCRDARYHLRKEMRLTVAGFFFAQVVDLEKREEEKAKLAAEKAAAGTTTIGFGGPTIAGSATKEEEGTTTIGFGASSASAAASSSAAASTTVFGFGATASTSAPSTAAATLSSSSKENTNNAGVVRPAQTCSTNIMQVRCLFIIVCFR